uniref:ArgoN domain-containing protein n=1 Tax=Bursaphelenchus xylophilus TaxID=6326 RepID=A0A1I7RX41_BURXY
MSSGPKTTLNPNKNTLTEKTKIENEAVELLKSLSLKEGDTSVMPKPAPGTVGKPFTVATNMYAVKVPDRKIYRYDMTISGVTPKDKTVEFTKKSEESLVIADRVNVCRTTWRVIFHNHPDFFGRDPHAVYYDLQSTLYSLQPLPMPDDTLTLTIDIADINSEEERAVFKGIRRIDILIKKAKSNVIELGDLSTIHNPETGKKDRSILNIIELIVNQTPMFSEKQFLSLRGSTAYVVDAAKYGLEEVPLDEGQTKYLAAGVKRSGCYIEGWSEGQNAVGMLLETRRSPFHSCLNLIDYIHQHASLRRYYNDFIRGQASDRDLGHITAVLRKIVFNVTHNKSRRIEVSGFHRSNCTTMNPSIGCSLEEYFYKQGIKLEMPRCHAVLVKNKGQHIYYPPEMLVVADNQLVLEKQMEAREKAAMIKIAAVRPDVLVNESRAGAAAIKLRDSPYTEASGVKFSKDVMKVQARQLPAPVMEYSSGVSHLKNGEAAWDQLPFVRGARIKNYSLYVIGTEGQMEPAICEADQKRLQQHLKTAANRFGMDIGQLADTRWIFDYEVDDVIAQNAEHGVDLVYFISPESIKTAHGRCWTLGELFFLVLEFVLA